jgi:hypothetical protein
LLIVRGISLLAIAISGGAVKGFLPLGKGGVVLPNMKWLLMATIDLLLLRLVRQPGPLVGKFLGLHFEYCGSSFLYRG